jgi:hypothetical protein
MHVFIAVFCMILEPESIIAIPSLSTTPTPPNTAKF